MPHSADLVAHMLWAYLLLQKLGWKSGFSLAFVKLSKEGVYDKLVSVTVFSFCK